MDIVVAKDTLAGAVIIRQREVEALQLAITILNETFAAEFQMRDAALAEAANLARDLDAERTKNRTLIEAPDREGKA